MENNMNEAVQAILDMPDEKLKEYVFSLNSHDGKFVAHAGGEIAYGTKRIPVDDDGFPLGRNWDGVPGTIAHMLTNIKDLQEECWIKFNTNPQISTAISDNGGIVCGKGFGVSSPYQDVSIWLDSFLKDSRNRLVTDLKKMYIRSEIEGELYLAFTVHDNGFVEVDFMDPKSLVKIHRHPFKRTFPLLFEFVIYGDSGEENDIQNKLIPSVTLLEYPELLVTAKKLNCWDTSKLLRYNERKNKKTSGFQTFIVTWDKSLFTDRNVSQMRTTIEWTNHYENLKRYEIDHKKASGYYANVVTFEDPKAFKMWLAMTPEQRALTGIEQKKTPGGTLVMPPGMKLEIKNPQLQRISEQDTDILHMITSGLNKPEDMITGQSNGTYGSVKASRGPESDRNANRREDFELFLRYDFFKYAFLLSSKMKKIKLEREEKAVIDFKEGEPVDGTVKKSIWESLEILFPVSEVSDVESTTKALLGVKHGSLADTLGIPRSVIAAKLGMTNYRSLRLKAATEEKYYPKLALSAVDSDVIDSSSESTMLETKKTDNNQNKTSEEKLNRRKVADEKKK